MPIGQYSIESIFDFIHDHLSPHLPVEKMQLPCNGTALLSLLRNMVFIRKASHPLIHITGDAHYALLLAGRCKTILTIHDCGALVAAKGWKKRILSLLWFYLPVRKADRVVAISEATAEDITRYTGYPREKIHIIPSFTSKVFPFKERPLLKGPCQVLVFSQSENKNLDRFIEAARNLSVKLLIIGTLKEEQKQRLHGYQIDVAHIERASEAELTAFYQRAHILLFASTKEGFGMPIVEAQQQGLPVITSNCS